MILSETKTPSVAEPALSAYEGSNGDVTNHLTPE
jgi:hypothetical protein